MKDSALSVANYFIDLAQRSDQQVKPLKLMKLVYIAHGFMLALLNRSALNPRFDRVEAWKYGPVIPSVYHSFKQYGNSSITNKTIVFDWEGEEPNVVTPELQDNDAKTVCEFVWNRYLNYSDNDLVTILHGAGTPWAYIYQEGKNLEIPDELTKVYYKGLVRRLVESVRDGE